jgi:hypothetical protein
MMRGVMMKRVRNAGICLRADDSAQQQQSEQDLLSGPYHLGESDLIISLPVLLECS